MSIPSPVRSTAIVFQQNYNGHMQCPNIGVNIGVSVDVGVGIQTRQRYSFGPWPRSQKNAIKNESEENTIMKQSTINSNILTEIGHIRVGRKNTLDIEKSLR